jgi:Protein of unknown function DUF262
MFKVRPFESKTLSWWNSERESIDFRPPYQRKGGLWSPLDKAYLIDSILNDFDIPKMYIADFTYVNSLLNDKQKSYAVVDGKQRFEAIFDFYDGKLTLASDFKYFSTPDLSLAGLTYKDLAKQYPKVASKFDNFNLTVMSIITDEESKINELFIRLNTSKPLNGAEIRGAMGGDIPKLIKRIADQNFFKNNIRFDTKRKQDHNAAAKMLLTEFRGKFADTKRTNLDRFVEEGIKSESVDFSHSCETVISVLGSMAQSFSQKDPLLRSSGPLTVYFWLYRNYAEQYKDLLREFIVKFEANRSLNRKQATSGTQYRADEDFLNYDISIRNPNDSGSLAKCYAVLEKKLLQFVKLNESKQA